MDKMIIVQKSTLNDVALIQIREGNNKSSFYCPYKSVGAVIDANLKSL